jgi:hypothetical protein
MIGYGALGVQRGGDWNGEPFGQLYDFPLRLRGHHTASSDDDGSTGFGQEPQGIPDHRHLRFAAEGRHAGKGRFHDHFQVGFSVHHHIAGGALKIQMGGSRSARRVHPSAYAFTPTAGRSPTVPPRPTTEAWPTK